MGQGGFGSQYETGMRAATSGADCAYRGACHHCASAIALVAGRAHAGYSAITLPWR